MYVSESVYFSGVFGFYRVGVMSFLLGDGGGGEGGTGGHDDFRKFPTSAEPKVYLFPASSSQPQR